MVTFGRKASAKIGIPNNRGMADRANKQLEGYAFMKAEQFTTALGVDAPYFYFWHNGEGSIPCSCSAAPRGPNSDIDIGGMTKTGSTEQSPSRKPEFEFIDTDYGKESIDELFGNPVGNKTRASLKDKLLTNDYQDPTEDFNEFDDDIRDIEGPEESPGITGFDDPLNLFSDKVIDCPICLASGYIDTWSPHGGKRFVFETSNAYDFYCEGIDINDKHNPTLLTSDKAGKVFWQFQLPLVWDRILRVNLYNGVNLIAPYLYNWVFTDSTNAAFPMTVDNLDAKNNDGDVIKMMVTFAEQGIEFTHAEIIFAYSEARKAQIPEVAQGYEQEFLDWNVTLTVELPPDLQISEGDYLTESKYRKVWKVSTLTKKMTAAGTVYGLSADLRALHSFEKDFVQLALFTTNYLTGNLVK
jgi:hypothetical protein